jgi:hypothetical protein
MSQGLSRFKGRSTGTAAPPPSDPPANIDAAVNNSNDDDAFLSFDDRPATSGSNGFNMANFGMGDEYEDNDFGMPDYSGGEGYEGYNLLSGEDGT